jgi:choline dehydrogenase
VNSSYDYIVAGAGSAGCVVASRLSEQPDVSVLLIEAGPRDRNPWIHAPGGIFKLIHNPALDWCFETEPEAGLGGRTMRWPRGKVLGGSSSINGMVYIRGQRDDFDAWCALGNAGWSYADVLPYFRRSEDQRRGADAFHGNNGPLTVADPQFRLPLVDAFVDAAVQAGIARQADFNGAQQEGAGYFQLNVRDGRRCSAAKAFLDIARGRPNLDIVTGALVHRIVVTGARATGIEYSQGNRTHIVHSRREVVLCAGAINSPQILQLSGIGDAAQLRTHGIGVVQHLPGVGRNLQDHLQAKTIFKTREPITLNDQARTLLRRMRIGADYVLRRKGPLSFGASLAGAFTRSDPALSRPDIQFHFQPLSLDRFDAPLHPFSAFTMSGCHLQPRSRGEILLRSADPRQHPIIRANYLAAAEDRHALVEGVRIARRIAAAPALAAHIACEWKPGPAVDTDDEILAYVRSIASTVFHPSGTCRMGQGDDAVVDAQLRVRGVDGLRVADASIMPTIVSGNTNAAAIMIGEKAADMILAAARSGYSHSCAGDTPATATPAASIAASVVASVAAASP